MMGTTELALPRIVESSDRVGIMKSAGSSYLERMA